ncbi:hypothetical protein Bhyg_02884 [Pseudolycoriella hygida]|uniref:Uncharacterized protein n=1 Tax=Pseudolycoriella hygida TaxID=35572 RepID=A0A9Q0NDG5_9DIPT|nr:hypothetical protein Bhyg_02884 [Pseudolycoriella hygida]
MVLTNAEKKQRYIEKLKASGRYEAFKKKKAFVEKCRQERIKEEWLLKKRQAKTSAIVTHLDPGTTSNCLGQVYNAKSALSKATKKVKHKNDRNDIIVAVTSPKKEMPAKSIETDVINAVLCFYERDDVSRMSPNMRDCRNFKCPDTGVKTLKPIRHLTYKLNDVYNMFLKHIKKDETSHTKDEIACYLYSIISKIPASVKTLKIWSDGPNNQFKNRFMGALIKLFQKMLNIQIFWNFFAASHGKGVVDGIGATVKTRVRRLVKSRRAIVENSKDFAKAFNSETSLIDVTHMPAAQAAKIRKDLDLEEVFASAPPVPDVFFCHQMQCVNDKIIAFPTSREGYDYYRKFNF